MAENLEIEYKTMLTKRDYERLVQHFQSSTKTFKNIKQKNAYYDSPDFVLKANKYGLRIRTIDSDSFAESTLKVPKKTGRLEINNKMNLTVANQYIDQSEFPETESYIPFFQPLELSFSKLRKFGELETKRLEIQLPIGLLAIDKSDYAGITDYELELEVAEAIQGKSDFFLFLEEHQLPYIKAKNKVGRMAEALQL
ncbi:MAG: CYTH domain-containing protein [Streptococcaceae bacterium]|jgi:uncharacterized protein YjbK|nr:CYTH domain-containing protein [Streptococcaceae bacterium]